MEMGKGGGTGEGAKGSWRKKIQVVPGKVRRFPGFLWETIYGVGRDDPRRVVHAIKVGCALTLVSLLYLLEPLFEGIGQNAIWAVMTVVVVLEFTAGATLCKGLNRGLGTLLAGSLAFLIEYIAEETGTVFRAVFIGVAVFTIGASTTYVRFIPNVKKNYDYGVVIFLLTFNLITVSSYRVGDVLKIAVQRLYTIAIGCGICLVTSLFIIPIWSGSDLHNSTASKLEGLAKATEACVKEYFADDDKNQTSNSNSSEDPIYEGYRAVLDSKTQDETMALHASWEPRHSLRCKYPWQQYVKLGTVLRHFGYTIVALHGCLQTEIQTPRYCRALFKGPCIRLASEVSKVLMELATSVKTRRHCNPEILSDHLHEALQDLNAALKSQPRLFLGSNNNNNNNNTNEPYNVLALLAAQAKREDKQGPGTGTPSYCLPSFKTDSYALQEWKAASGKEQRGNGSREGERKMLRPQLSKIAMTSVEFSEALPFAAFASLLLEAVARLDRVIEEVEELGKMACFREFNPGCCNNHEVVVNCGTPRSADISRTNLPSAGVE